MGHVISQDHVFPICKMGMIPSASQNQRGRMSLQKRLNAAQRLAFLLAGVHGV